MTSHVLGAPDIGAGRRTPVQERSAQRVELILDTAALLIDEIGWAGVSISKIAQRSETTGPSVYRYFPDLQSIVAALAQRNLRRFVTRVAEVLGDSELPWQGALGAVVDTYAEFFRSEPGFRWLRLGDPIDRFLLSGRESNRTLLARHTCQMFFERYEVDWRVDLLEHVEVIVEISDVLTARAFESAPEVEAFFLDQCKRIVVGYLREYLSRPHPILDRPVDWMTTPRIHPIPSAPESTPSVP
jgi:AcrR family transcriptional regulator